MKNSNKLLLTALFLVIGFLATYNLALLAEYRKGDYKDPYTRFTALNLKNFNTVEVNAASKISVKVMAGPYQVRVFNDLADFVKVKQAGATLQINLDLPEDTRLFGPPYQVIVSCPVIKTLRTNATYTVNGKKITNYKIPEPYLNPHTTVQGFTQDSLLVQQNNTGLVNLADNSIRKLKAVVGVSNGSTNTLTIAKGNTLHQADLDMRNKSELILNDVLIPKLQYQLSDSTKVTCSGASLSIIKSGKK